MSDVIIFTGIFIPSPKNFNVLTLYGVLEQNQEW